MIHGIPSPHYGLFDMNCISPHALMQGQSDLFPSVRTRELNFSPLSTVDDSPMSPKQNIC